MALPPSLMASTSPIVDKALETGARGSTITKTDYGVIGDAMFRKAQLDLNIATLQSNFGLEKARIQSNLLQNEAELKMTWMDRDRHYKLAKEENELSGSEKIFGALSGAIQGGVAGAATGGKAGAIVGAVLGGGAAYAGGQSGGRRGQQSALNFVQTASTAAVAFKDYNDAQKSKDSWKSIVEAGSAIASRLGDPKDAQAQADWGAHRAAVMQQMADDGLNGQQISEGWSAYEKSMRTGTASIDPVEAGKAGLMKSYSKAMSDPRRNSTDRADQTALLDELYTEMNTNYAMATGFEKNQMPERTFAGMIGGDSSPLGKVHNQRIRGSAVDEVVRGGPSTPSNPTGRSVSPSAGTSGRSQVAQQQEQTPSPVPQSVPQMSQPMGNRIGNSGGAPIRPLPQGPGVEWTTPLKAEMALAEQGGEVAETLSKQSRQQALANSDGAPEPVSRASRVDSLRDTKYRGGKQDSERVKAWREDKTAGGTVDVTNLSPKIKSNRVLAEEQASLDKEAEAIPLLMKHGDEAGKKEGKKADTAVKAIDQLIALVENDKVPTGVGVKKGAAVTTFEKGMGAGVGAGIGGVVGGIGGAAGGAAIGSIVPGAGTVAGAVTGGLSGAGTGAATGMKLGQTFEFGKGSGWGLTKSEEQALTRANSLKQTAVYAVAKTQDTGGKVAKDDYETLAPLFYNPRLSKEANLQQLLQQKRNVITGASSAAADIDPLNNDDAIDRRLKEQELLNKRKTGRKLDLQLEESGGKPWQYIY